MIMKKALFTVILAAAAAMAPARDSKMDEFVTSLMQRMTLQEKIGQLTLLGAGDIVTGSGGKSPVEGRWTWFMAMKPSSPYRWHFRAAGTHWP